MTKRFAIDGRSIGQDNPPYIIAELSANHNGNIDRAIKLIREAKSAGADAIKIQTYRPDTITIDSKLPDFQITDGLWAGYTLYELYDWAHTPWEWHQQLFDYAKEIGITIFSSPFDKTAVDLLEDLNTPAYKIASFEAVDLELIRYVSSTNKPIIISTGMANVEEIEEAISTAQDAGCNELSILHCVSGYPAPAADYNLQTIPAMIDRFGLVVGLSDHTLDNTTAVASIALGASIIEKHFTLDRNGQGPDDSFSQEPFDMKNLCKNARIAWEALGDENYSLKSSEQGNLKFRRSLYFVKDLKEGDIISASSVKSIRPGFGLKPRFLDQVIGTVATSDIVAGTAVTWKNISKKK